MYGIKPPEHYAEAYLEWRRLFMNRRETEDVMRLVLEETEVDMRRVFVYPMRTDTHVMILEPGDTFREFRLNWNKQAEAVSALLIASQEV